MSESIQEISKTWQIDEPQFKALGKLVYSFIKSNITEFEIFPEISYRTKDLLSIVKKIKKKLREKPYSYSYLNDKLGVRIICTFQEDLDKVDQFIKKYFLIKKAEYKRDKLDFDKLDYISNHYDLTINTDIKGFNKHVALKNLVFELQVRTLNQHVWSNTAHSLSYKQEAAIAPILQRKIYRLLSLYEIADDEFSMVNKALLLYPDNEVYTLLRKLENKIYKYAQVDYDRETSLYTLRILLNYFEESERKCIFTGLDEFIQTNEIKIRRIFNENKIRYFEIPLLTQPEVFLVWYAIDNLYYSIVDNWANDFDISELEQISILWGKTIN